MFTRVIKARKKKNSLKVKEHKLENEKQTSKRKRKKNELVLEDVK